MNVYPPEKIRNVALVGHSGSGKTTLAEALLYRAGRISRLGRVEDGSTVMDYDPEEHKRGMSLSLSYAPFEWKGHKINLLDTPGYADFLGDLHAAMRVADLAVFVVSAVEGVEVGTERAWRIAEQLGVPRMIFINKLDKERSSFQRTLDQLRDQGRGKRRRARHREFGAVRDQELRSGERGEDHDHGACQVEVVGVAAEW